MGYESLQSTKMLATHCAVCARPLRDAQSVELGIGPDCRRKYGYNDAINDANRARANQLIYMIADAQTGVSVAEACAELRSLGFVVLADKVLERLISVKVARVGDLLQVTAPYSPESVEAMRGIPGRRWDKEAKVNTFPYASKGALWATLKRLYPGQDMQLPDGSVTRIA